MVAFGPWWWSSGPRAPFTLTIRVRIPLNRKNFLCWKEKQKEAGVGPLKKYGYHYRLHNS